ncbi:MULTISPECIES: N-acetylmuramoyl-L-alanine amidase family protein [Dyella]|uniref:N-acetylmuramoyl-L-alanine amidase n=2 Tax=Dyella TaxID=231454 RepID=A0A4V6NA13_9GAMM|nr:MULTISPECIES: N-acetylmuramoyl-L-alanine amidase [Dyella]TBR40080.1 N-acetylmuramoyl-L-alanine amidase [Dyella terrae]TCI12337.1 N-acetylmuramoyl-L-alanine amidase [Dyella soli]
MPGKAPLSQYPHTPRIAVNFALAVALVTSLQLPSKASATNHIHDQRVPIALLPDARKADFEARISQDISYRLSLHQLRSPLPLPASAMVSLDAASGRLVVDLGTAMGPYSLELELEDLQGEFLTSADQVTKGVAQVTGILLLFGGKDAYFYHPEAWRAPPPSLTPHSSINTKSSQKIAVTAGHGYYYHHGYKDWRLQRDWHNGMVEDLTTPNYALMVSAWLQIRSDVGAIYPRGMYIGIHQPSGKHWYEMGARYNLERAYPNNPEIWNSRKGSSEHDREQKEDVYSRPFFANHIGADAAINLHTNGDGDPTIRGARAFYQLKDSTSKTLGDRVLCYMREQVDTLDKYRDYLIDKSARDSNYAENRESKMPSVIVEVGFHSNPEDAAAMQDNDFVVAATRGIAKGYRAFSNGWDCSKFDIESISDVVANETESAPVSIDITGHPEIPITVEFEPLDCPAGWIDCESTIRYIVDPTTPMVTTLFCGRIPQTGTAIWRSRLRDFDGIVTDWATLSQTCINSDEKVPEDT